MQLGESFDWLPYGTGRINIAEAAVTCYTEKSLCLAFYTGCIIIVGCRKIKEKYHGYRQYQNIFYVVYDSERSIAGSLVANLCLCQRLGLPNAQQVVFHFPRNLQRGDILVHRAIQNIGLCVQSYSLCGSADRRIKRSIQQTQIRTCRQGKDSV